jgi:biofilm PGA synthesis protein PgaD
MTYASLIIDRSATRSAWNRSSDWVLTAIVWALYLYMIRDAVTELGYLISESLNRTFVGIARSPMMGTANVFDTLRLYGVIVLANAAVLIGWALYNQLRFRGRERRKARRLVTVDDLATLYQLPAEDISKWQTSRILKMRHNGDGILEAVVATHAV